MPTANDRSRANVKYTRIQAAREAVVAAAREWNVARHRSKEQDLPQHADAMIRTSKMLILTLAALAEAEDAR